uniref:Uncharacterized protein n=2 Tax=Aegilops tauschii subsp. strangulata TaxID=200361 RepID=A0A453FU40_AEGTS
MLGLRTPPGFLFLISLLLFIHLEFMMPHAQTTRGPAKVGAHSTSLGHTAQAQLRMPAHAHGHLRQPFNAGGAHHFLTIRRCRRCRSAPSHPLINPFHLHRSGQEPAGAEDGGGCWWWPGRGRTRRGARASAAAAARATRCTWPCRRGCRSPRSTTRRRGGAGAATGSTCHDRHKMKTRPVSIGTWPSRDVKPSAVSLPTPIDLGAS